MKTSLATIAIGVVLLASSPTVAGERTVVLDVRGLTCASCAYIVKRSLATVDGVTAIDVSMAGKTATVTYDDGKTDVANLTQATDAMGFPSSPKE